MEKIDKTIQKLSRAINVNNDNNVSNGRKKNNKNNAINVNIKRNKYALDKTKFTPNTPETQLAEKIANYFNDLDNYAFYLRVVNMLGIDRAYKFYRSIQEEVIEKASTRFQIRDSKKYFAWKFKNRRKFNF